MAIWAGLLREMVVPPCGHKAKGSLQQADEVQGCHWCLFSESLLVKRITNRSIPSTQKSKQSENNMITDKH